MQPKLDQKSKVVDNLTKIHQHVFQKNVRFANVQILSNINIGAVQQASKSSACKKNANVVDLKNCCKMNRCSPDSRGKVATAVSNEQRS